MGKYNYEIYTTGYANEIVVGTLDEKTVEKVEQLCDEHDLSLAELFNDYDLLTENELSEWHENDNKEHVYGPSMDGSTINVINVETNDVLLEKRFFNLESFELEQHSYELRTHEYEDEPIFHYATVEKGVAIQGYLELDEPFEESKLTFKVINLEVDYHEYEIVTELYYDGELIEAEVVSTDYKDSIADIIIG